MIYPVPHLSPNYQVYFARKISRERGPSHFSPPLSGYLDTQVSRHIFSSKRRFECPWGEMTLDFRPFWCHYFMKVTQSQLQISPDAKSESDPAVNFVISLWLSRSSCPALDGQGDKTRKGFSRSHDGCFFTRQPSMDSRYVHWMIQDEFDIGSLIVD